MEDLIDFLELAEWDDKKEEIQEVEAKVTDQERTVDHLTQQLNEDLRKEHEARNNNDPEAVRRFERLRRKRKEDLKHEKEILQEVQIERDHVKGRVENLLRDAFNEMG